MDLVDQALEWIERAAGVLSIVSFVVAIWAALRVRKLNSAWRDLLRIQELRDELTDKASNISVAAPNVANDREAILRYLSEAEAILISLKGSIGGRFLFWSRRRALILSIERVRTKLNQCQGDSNLNSPMTWETYRQISQVVLRVGHHIEDRRLER